MSFGASQNVISKSHIYPLTPLKFSDEERGMGSHLRKRVNKKNHTPLLLFINSPNKKVRKIKKRNDFCWPLKSQMSFFSSVTSLTADHSYSLPTPGAYLPLASNGTDRSYISPAASSSRVTTSTSLGALSLLLPLSVFTSVAPAGSFSIFT